MTPSPLPILYSFRRCPYAMRGRMGVYVSGVVCELREVVLRDKPDAMLDASPKGTVPVLQTVEGDVIEESLELMLWALKQHDPQGWLRPELGSLDEMLALIDLNDHAFKDHLDRYKYPNRYEGVDPLFHRHEAENFLQVLERRLTTSPFLFGSRISLADIAIAPFMRQFAHVDKEWFDHTPYKALQEWLSTFLNSSVFTEVMAKFAPWKEGDAPVLFPQG